MVCLPPFELVYQEHKAELYGFLLKRLPREDAADAFQETFLRALRTYTALDHARELRAWLFTIARSVLADRARRAAARPVEVSVTAEPMRGDHQTRTTDPETLTEDAAAVAALTSALPPTERAAVVLRYVHDLEYREIGSALESSPDAARQAASSGIRRMRRQLSEIPHAPDDAAGAKKEARHDTPAH